MGKKRRARKMREGKGGAYVNEDATKITKTPQYPGHYPSSHLMVDNISKAKKRDYKVWPLISPDETGEYKTQGEKEAEEKGELFKFKSKRRAEKFARGSWKKGRKKRMAMQDYRQRKRENARKKYKK